MAIDSQTVHRVAKLARIRITEEEAHTLQGELSGILNWVEQLEEVDISGVDPMTSAIETQMRWRQDGVNDGEIASSVTQNAPLSEDHFYMVPKVVE